MYLGTTKQAGSNGIPIWQKVFHTAQGGFALDATGLVVGSILPKGSMMDFNEATRLAKPILSGVVVTTASGGATQYQIAKGTLFAVGKNAALTVGGAAYAITAIETSASNYDTITVATTLGPATVGQAIFISSANGASAATYGGTPDGLLYDDVVVDAGAPVSIVTSGVVYARRIPGVPVATRTANEMKDIQFSESF